MNKIKQRALVSVIIPCYNNSRTLLRAFNSILKQELLPAEIIFINDASSDKTSDLLSKLKRQYSSFVKVVSLKKNQGVATARNAGLAIATQPYIAFLDADDAWHPKKLEIQYTYMLANPDVLLSGHNHKIMKKITELPLWDTGSWKVKTLSKWELILSNQFITPSLMLKRSILLHFDSGMRHMEDHRLWTDIVACGGKAVKLDIPLASTYKYSFGQSGLSSQLWQMEKSDLANVSHFFDAGYVNRLQCFLLKLYSLIKFARRLLIISFLLRWLK